MIRKEWKRMLALSMTYIMTLSVAAPVKAAEEELDVPTAETAAEVQETPEQFEARTGYHLSEGYTYVLNNGFVIAGRWFATDHTGCNPGTNTK